MNWMTDVDKAIAFVLSVSALITIIIKVISWGKMKRKENMRKQAETLQILRDLCSGQQMLYNTVNKISHRLDNMDEERNKSREDDAYIRTRMYLGTVAAIDAIMRLAEHEGLKINGDIEKYRQENIDNLKKGKGVTVVRS